MFNYSTLQYKLRYSYARVIPALYKAGFHFKAKKISECGHYKELAVCKECGETYLNGFNTCKDRFCPVCEKKRSYLWLAKLAPIIQEYISNKKYVNMVTLTIKNGTNLAEQLRIINQCWRVLVHDDKILRKEFKERFVGGFKALEVKRGKLAHLWHCHYHLLVIKDKYSKDFTWIKQAWQKAYKLVTGEDISLQVRVDAIKNTGKEEIGQILEVAKYVTKFDWDFTEDVEELVLNLHGVRVTSTWGILKKSLTEQSIECDMNLKLTDVIKLVCKNCGNDTFEYLENVTGTDLQISDYVDDELTKLERQKNKELEDL